MRRILFVLSLFIGGAWAHAGGFAQPDQSASAAGVANAYVATADDTSALAYNPAGIAWQSGVSVTAGLRMGFRDSSVSLPAGSVAPNDGNETAIGYAYASWMPHDSRFGAGIGISPLYQVNNDWRTAFPAAAGVTKLTVDHGTLDIIYAISSDLAFAAGGDWYVTRATLSQGVQNFQGNDLTSFGGHVSLMWKPIPAWSVGLMLRSGSRISISGQANDKLSFKLPDEVTAGIAHDFDDVWRLEADVKWTRWSAMRDLNVSTAGVVSQSNPLNLRDSLTVMTGLIWTWRQNSQFRMGYAYDQGANRSTSFNPVIADQDGHRISLGAGGEAYGIHLDLAYTYTYYTKKAVAGAFAGTYRDRKQSVSFSVSRTFD
jgi:long-subunit fatty acid transport protein